MSVSATNSLTHLCPPPNNNNHSDNDPNMDTHSFDHSFDQSSSNKGKAHDAPTSSGNGGFRAQAGMTVQPPRPEDLQKSYASIVEEVHNPGWYGSMSTSLNLTPLLLSY